MQCNAMQCNAMQCNAMQCNATQSNFMQGIASSPSVRTKPAPLVRTQVSAAVWFGSARRRRRCQPRQGCLACTRTSQLLTEVQLPGAERLLRASRIPGVSDAGLESVRGSSIWSLPCQIVVVLSCFRAGVSCSMYWRLDRDGFGLSAVSLLSAAVFARDGFQQPRCGVSDDTFAVVCGQVAAALAAIYSEGGR